VNQAEVTALVMARLVEAAATDPLRWTPAVGIAAGDAHEDGLGVSLFGSSPTRKQLGVLAHVLFRLWTDGQIEVADFRPNRRTGQLGPPLQIEQAAYGLVAGGSQPLRVRAEREYGVRLCQAHTV
jgi:hypothetical protein